MIFSLFLFKILKYSKMTIIFLQHSQGLMTRASQPISMSSPLSNPPPLLWSNLRSFRNPVLKMVWNPDVSSPSTNSRFFRFDGPTSDWNSIINWFRVCLLTFRAEVYNEDNIFSGWSVVIFLFSEKRLSWFRILPYNLCFSNHVWHNQ